jgi:hypothetical protein
MAKSPTIISETNQKVVRMIKWLQETLNLLNRETAFVQTQIAMRSMTSTTRALAIEASALALLDVTKMETVTHPLPAAHEPALPSADGLQIPAPAPRMDAVTHLHLAAALAHLLLSAGLLPGKIKRSVAQVVVPAVAVMSSQSPNDWPRNGNANKKPRTRNYKVSVVFSTYLINSIIHGRIGFRKKAETGGRMSQKSRDLGPLTIGSKVALFRSSLLRRHLRLKSWCGGRNPRRPLSASHC